MEFVLTRAMKYTINDGLEPTNSGEIRLKMRKDLQNSCIAYIWTAISNAKLVHIPETNSLINHKENKFENTNSKIGRIARHETLTNNRSRSRNLKQIKQRGKIRFIQELR